MCEVVLLILGRDVIDDGVECGGMSVWGKFMWGRGGGVEEVYVGALPQVCDGEWVGVVVLNVGKSMSGGCRGGGGMCRDSAV